MAIDFLELYFPYLKYHKGSSPNQSQHRDSPILPGRTLCSSPQIQNDTHPHAKIKYVHLTTTIYYIGIYRIFISLYFN